MAYIVFPTWCSSDTDNITIVEIILFYASHHTILAYFIKNEQNTELVSIANTVQWVLVSYRQLGKSVSVQLPALFVSFLQL